MDSKTEAVIAAARAFLQRSIERHRALPDSAFPDPVGHTAKVLRAALADYDASPDVARPLADWHEDFGDVLWWEFPIQEAPWCGSPLSSAWPGYHTHWTKLPPPPETSHD